MKRITAIVAGRIQNVGYRARIIAIAKESGITGTVQNLVGGKVKIIAEGEEGYLKKFLDAIRIKNTLIDVEDVLVEYSNATGEYGDFYKLVGDGETDERLDKASEYLKELIMVTKSGFSEMKEEIVGVKEEIVGVKEEIVGVKEEIVGVREEMRSGFTEMRGGFEMLSSKQDDTTDEIRALRGDLKGYMDWKLEKVKSELEEKFESGFDEIRNVLRDHGMIVASSE